MYDEFGSIFLLILITRHHFALQDHELGIGYQGSFILKFLRGGHLSRDPTVLSEHENQRLSDWIRGLYETEGISDELMSTCSPKDFHLLVATLFDQSLKACQAGKLGLDTLKGGFECESLRPSGFRFQIRSESVSSQRILYTRLHTIFYCNYRSLLIHQQTSWNHSYFPLSSPG